MFGIGQEKLALFIGGAVVGAVGLTVAKTPKAREVAVKGLAQGFMVKDTVMEEVTNIREDAEELVLEAKLLAKKECNCD